MPAEWHMSRPIGDSSDTRPDQAVARLAAEEWGVLSMNELRACGLSQQAVADRANAGRFHRQHHGVYAIGHPNLPLEGRFLAAVKACGPAAVLSHHAATAHWGLLPWEERLIDVTVEGTTQ